jgi:hypothetical protein
LPIFSPPWKNNERNNKFETWTLRLRFLTIDLPDWENWQLPIFSRWSGKTPSLFFYGTSRFYMLFFSGFIWWSDPHLVSPMSMSPFSTTSSASINSASTPSTS